MAFAHVPKPEIILRPIMTSIKCICIDLSGTLHVGDQPTDGAVDALKRLRTSNLPIRFVTNTTKESGARLLDRLQRIGFELSPDEIFSSLSAARAHVVQHRLRPLYLLTDDARRDFPALVTTDGSIISDKLSADGDAHLNAVVVGLAPEQFNYDAMNRAFRILLRPDSTLVAIHEGKYYRANAAEKVLSLGPGCFVRGLEYAANCKATVVGKPNAYFFRSAVPSDIRLDECVMIGDDPLDDAKGAIDVGMKAVLVKTGKYRSDIQVQCDMLADSFADAVGRLFDQQFTI